MPRPNARAVAAHLLRNVAIGHRSLDRVFVDADVPEADRALVQEMVYGSVRHFYSLSNEVHSRLHTPLKARDAIVFCLLVIGVYQLRHLRIPHYAVVNETVAATDQVGRSWARGLVNQLLRRAASEGPVSPIDDEQALDHPQWLISLLQRDYPDAWRAILAASLTRAPLTLRVNLSANDRDTYRRALAANEIAAQCGPTDEALVLDQPVAAARLPGFREGHVSVQDLHAMWAAHLLDVPPRGRVLDACAAPGGKSMHLLERYPGIALTALDVDAERCEVLRAECARCRMDPSIVVRGDATRLDWWDGSDYDAVLLDAPCSGTGTLRRHPDIKLLKRGTDILQYQDLQSDMLTNLWSVLAPGGHLLYCTCSILSAENDDVIDRSMQRLTGATAQPLVVPGSLRTKFGCQLLPEIGGGDGFYFALLTKAA